MKRTDKKGVFGQQTSKVTQLADTLSQAISIKEFLEGDSLPSINQLSAQYSVSRATVFKAFLRSARTRINQCYTGKRTQRILRH